MLRKPGVLLLVLVMVLAFVGCDQLKGAFQTSLGSTKTAATAETGQQTAQPVYGTVLAKVNGDTITLE
ncbi:MAG: hypothetical protein WC409_06155, partial [Candidatus Omnitrophota bacterium]